MKVSNEIHIIGAGSIGLLWGYYLSKVGKVVNIISKKSKPQVNQIHLVKDTRVNSVKINFTSPKFVDAIDLLLVCTKAFDSKTACVNLKHSISEHTTIILLQNGIGMHEEIAEIFPNNAIYLGITTEAAKRVKPLTVNHTGNGRTEFGIVSGNALNRRLINKLNCRLPITINGNIHKAAWRKLVINCCINPLTVIFDCLNGELLHNPSALELSHSILKECKMVAEQIGTAHYLDNIEKDLEYILNATATNSSSMREDILNARPTEINYLTGYIIQQSRSTNLSIPTNKWVYQQIKSIEATQGINPIESVKLIS